MRMQLHVSKKFRFLDSRNNVWRCFLLYGEMFTNANYYFIFSRAQNAKCFKLIHLFSSWEQIVNKMYAFLV